MAGRIRPKVVMPAVVGQRVRLNDWSYGTNKYQASGFIRQAYFNGLGRQVCQLQRLTLKFSKTSGTSSGLRDFIEHDLIDFARTNPGIALYLKPRRKPSPILAADYLNGTSHWCCVRHFSRSQVNEWINYYVTRSGEKVQRYRKTIHTDWPSVQGHWTTFLHLPAGPNQFPDDARGAFEPPLLTASQQLVRLQEQVQNLHILQEHPDKDD